MKRCSALAVPALVFASIVGGCASASNSSSSTAAATTPASHIARNSAQTDTPSKNRRVALITTKHGKLGTILAYGPKKLTVYLFAADRRAASTCTGGCADDWPPVIGSPRATGGAMSVDLGTIKRPDGTTQITYKSHPLYLFVKDKDDSDVYGQAIVDWGAEWYVLNPAGDEVEKSAGNEPDAS